MKKFLAAQDGVVTKKQLQRRLDRFVEYYNTERPRRGIGRRTPISVYASRAKATPTGAVVKTDGRRLRSTRSTRPAPVTPRHRGRLHHIGIGLPCPGWRIAMLIDGLNIEIVALDGSPLRTLVLDPTKDY